MDAKTVANTIIKQMGGLGKMSAMVSANGLVFGTEENGDCFVQFSFKGSRKINKCKVILNWDDTYTMEFWKISLRAKNPANMCVKKSDASGLYWDMLKPEFERVTGLYLSLGTMGN